MKNLKHTNGEWVDGNTSDSIIVKGLNDESDSDKFYGGFVICESVTENNKSIIKAAPEMLEALIFEAKISKDNIDGIPIRLKNIIEKATGLTLNEVL